jgi:hypothetical protein
MNDSARLIRGVYRFNPNEGLYDAITGSHGDSPAETFDTLRAATTAAAHKAGVAPPISAHNSIPNYDVTVSSPTKTCCATCFQPITSGTFFDCTKTRLFFCGKCGLQSSRFDYRQTTAFLNTLVTSATEVSCVFLLIIIVSLFVFYDELP